jgi:hypothetical protein
MMKKVVLITGASSGNGAYADIAKKVSDSMVKLYSSNSLTHAAVLGKVIARAATDKNPKRRYVKGFMAKPAIAVRKWFGDGLFDKIIMSQFK